MQKLLTLVPGWAKTLFFRADRSLQARILIPTAVLFAATLGAMGLSSLRLARAMNENSVVRSAELFTTVAAEGLVRVVEDRGPSAIPLALEALVRHGPGHHAELVSVSFVSPEGVRAFSTEHVLVGSSAWQGSAPPTRTRTIRSGPEDLTVLHPLGGPGQPAGPEGLAGHWLEVRFSREADQSAEASLAGALLLTAAPSLLVLVAIIWWLLGREATRPLSRLVTAMGRAAAGDPSVRADEGWRDELGVVARSFDATYAALQHSRAELESVHRERMERADRFAAVGEMASGLSHEIKNPLAGLSVALEMLEEDHHADHPRAEMIAEMRHQVNRVIEIMEGLLGFVREQPARMQDIDVNLSVNRAVRLVTQRCRAACNAPPAPTLAATLPLVHGDPAKLEQVFLNLVLNACQAMQGLPAGCRGHLGVTTCARGDQVVIEVSDQGPGIPPEARPNVFKPFFTTRTTGNGLGLAISERIVHDHGGHITFRCPPTGGTVFTVALPAIGGSRTQS